MCPACCRSHWLLALMNSADRRPNQLIALGGAWSPWVWSIPGLTGSSSRLKVHIYDDRLVCWLGTTQVLTLTRKHPKGKRRDRVVDYRHLAASLVRKPQAFRRSVFREELFPRPAFRRAWEVLDEGLDDRKACRVYVGLLHLAATGACEAALADHLDAVLDRGELPDLETARAAVAPPQPTAIPLIAVPLPDLAGYDRLLRPAPSIPDPEPT